MQVEQQTLTAGGRPFKLTAYWLDQIADFETAVNYPVIVICPGGGFTYHSDREAEPIALRFAAAGMHAVVLDYQLMTPTEAVYPTALQQVGQTLAWINDQAATHHIDAQRIILAGFSAGGHVVATFNSVATNPALRTRYHLDQYAGQHAATILGYPVIDLTAGFPTTADYRQRITTDEDLWAAQATATAATKPSFVWQTVTDELVPAMNSMLYVQALMRLKVPTEYHLFGTGIHGLSLANHVTAKPNKAKYLNQQAAQWVPLALHWLQTQGLLASE
ncbi:alpha/beta hydrolase [Lactiplantibacillus daowaiensis]|uniref:Alpha/beta hydrolase n=1 Tax=Lactiplantibacillus daowaiensis TaxID=2559918 RepID=A0ABW1RYG5_9LACO|nr:alpha/beta hydrolase [Lactiplantibacillus daowaiensis]